ncbi:MAG: CxxxxCH/CxxCH domain-containing protein, partial [Myxococcales bacterium]|nr:CxxxxCH/CxxCH domain-containing protein [Myxococcales bacterium]
HGLPPAGHPAGDCARCHPTAAPGRAIAVPVAHVDGQVDVRLLGRDDCADCHAAGGRAAPAGSHTAHARFECTACHPVVDEPIADHLDGQSPVTLGFGEYAEGRCSQTACHGVGQPVWGAAGSVTGCDACHGAPPVGHSEGPCTQCHPPPTDARHVNGRVDLELPDTCDACHGAPPATGAHLAHAQPSAAAPVACDACHRVPAQVQAPGHLGPSPAEVVLVTGRYEAGTCVDTDCHAGPGAADPAPAWEDGPRRCGDCHGIPPPDHLRRPCEECHRAVAGAGYRIAVPARHADGQVDFR